MVLTLHTVSVVVVQAVLTPRVHVEAAVQVVHGALPQVEKVLSASHGTLGAVVHTIGLAQELNAGRQLDSVHLPHSRALAGSPGGLDGRHLTKQLDVTQTPNVPKHAVQSVERPNPLFWKHVLRQIGP